MGISVTTTSRPVDTAPIAPTRSDSPGSTSLADLLAEVGMAIDAMSTSRIEHSSGQIAAITAHLVDGGHEAGADGGPFAPSRDTATVLSLRTLGRLAARTAGQNYTLADARALRIRDLLTTLAA